MADENDNPGTTNAAPESTTIQGLTPALFFAIFSALLLIMLAGGFAVAYFVLPEKIAEIMVKAPPAETAAASAPEEKESSHAAPKEEAKASEGGHGDELKKAIEKEVKAISGQEFRVQDILVNISGTRGGRFIKASLYFEANSDVIAELEGSRAKITDLISQILSSQTLDSLTRSDSRGRIRGELLTTVNAVLTKGKVENIYFTDFIIQ
jgi:flagellar FliL protein